MRHAPYRRPPVSTELDSFLIEVGVVGWGGGWPFPWGTPRPQRIHDRRIMFLTVLFFWPPPLKTAWLLPRSRLSPSRGNILEMISAAVRRSLDKRFCPFRHYSRFAPLRALFDEVEGVVPGCSVP